jgi:hypothetical protein
MQAVYALAALSMCVPAACHYRRRPFTSSSPSAHSGRRIGGGVGGADDDRGASSSGAPLVAQLLAFCLFEVCTGAFWPSMMQMRARYLPEAQRSTLMALFRAPLSAAVCAILWRAADVPLSSLFSLCALLLALAGLCQRRLARLTAGPPAARARRRGRALLPLAAHHHRAGGDDAEEGKAGGGGGGTAAARREEANSARSIVS